MREREKTNNTASIKTIRRPADSSSIIPADQVSGTVTTYNSTTNILNSINDIFAKQVDRFRIKVHSGHGLDHIENKMLTEIQKSVLAFEKHQAELAKNAELVKQLEGLSDIELIERTKAMLGLDKVIDFAPLAPKEET